jgi:hypothetical protein
VSQLRDENLKKSLEVITDFHKSLDELLKKRRQPIKP